MTGRLEEGTTSLAGTGKGPAEPRGEEGLLALAESLLRGCLPENQDGEFFPQTRPPGHRLWENSNHVSNILKEGGYGEGLPFGVRFKGFL